MSEGIFTLIGAAIGFFGAVYTAKVGRNKDLTEADIKSAIEGADRNVYKEVEKLNRQLKKEISDENIEHQNKWEQKKIDANIISKSIVSWLEDARKLSTNITAASIKTNQKYNNFCHYGNKAIYYRDQVILKREEIKRINKKDIVRIKELENEMNILMEALTTFEGLTNKCLEQSREARSIFHQNHIHFTLMFGYDERNNKLLQSIDKINEKINWFIDDQLKVGKEISWIELEEYCLWNTIQIDKELEKFVKDCRIYFKDEWDKAKFGKVVLNVNIEGTNVQKDAIISKYDEPFFSDYIYIDEKVNMEKEVEKIKLENIVGSFKPGDRYFTLGDFIKYRLTKEYILQIYSDKEQFEKYLTGENYKNEVITLVEVKGKYYVHGDGNHRVAIAKLIGLKEVTAMVLKLDPELEETVYEEINALVNDRNV